VNPSGSKVDRADAIVDGAAWEESWVQRSTGFGGACAGLRNPSAQRGFSRDNWPSCSPVCIELFVTGDGYALGHQVLQSTAMTPGPSRKSWRRWSGDLAGPVECGSWNQGMVGECTGRPGRRHPRRPRLSSSCLVAISRSETSSQSARSARSVSRETLSLRIRAIGPCVVIAR
jgi:hypothetical protein